MHLKLVSVLSMLAWASNFAIACEGECIVGITKAFVSNMTIPVTSVLRQMAEEINEKLVPPSSRPADPITFLQPLFTAYLNRSYDSMENAIFPSYFHGKCQRFSKDGQDPPGCPNPDCPVVCGTPGSLVHFYPKLRYIAYNDTERLLEELLKPDTLIFNQISQLVKNAQSNHRRSISTISSRDSPKGHAPDTTPSHHSFYTRGLGSVANKRIHLRHARADSSPALLSIFSQMRSLLKAACGGSVGEAKDDLRGCSWEPAMKAYILSFP